MRFHGFQSLGWKNSTTQCRDNAQSFTALFIFWLKVCVNHYNTTPPQQQDPWHVIKHNYYINNSISPLWSLALMSLSNSMRPMTTSLLPVRDAWWEAVNLSTEKKIEFECLIKNYVISRAVYHFGIQSSRRPVLSIQHLCLSSSPFLINPSLSIRGRSYNLLIEILAKHKKMHLYKGVDDQDIKLWLLSGQIIEVSKSTNSR